MEVTENLAKMDYSYQQIRLLEGKTMAAHNVLIILVTVYVACSQTYQHFTINTPVAQKSIVGVVENKGKQ